MRSNRPNRCAPLTPSHLRTPSLLPTAIRCTVPPLAALALQRPPRSALLAHALPPHLRATPPNCTCNSLFLLFALSINQRRCTAHLDTHTHTHTHPNTHTHITLSLSLSLSFFVSLFVSLCLSLSHFLSLFLSLAFVFRNKR